MPVLLNNHWLATCRYYKESFFCEKLGIIQKINLEYIAVTKSLGYTLFSVSLFLLFL